MPMQTDYSVSPPIAEAGMLASRFNDSDIATAYNAEASASIKFGLGVEYASTTEGLAAKLPNAQTDRIKGITLRTHSIDPGDRGELDDVNGVKVGGMLNLLKRGEVWVKVRTGCAPGDKLFIRAVAGAGVIGECENAADATNMIDATAKGEFTTYAAANGLAKLRVYF